MLVISVSLSLSLFFFAPALLFLLPSTSSTAVFAISPVRLAFVLESHRTTMTQEGEGERFICEIEAAMSEGSKKR